jgi:hypothetical protein
MKRETKSERLARLEAIREAEAAVEKAQYPMTLMETMMLASKAGASIFVEDVSTFSVTITDQWDDRVEFFVGVEHSQAYVDSLDQLRYTALSRIEKEAAAKALYDARLAALAKLTNAEREILGV